MGEIGLFAAGSPYPGQRLLYEGGAFVIEGSGPVDPSHLRTWDSQGLITWRSEETRRWFATNFGGAAIAATTPGRSKATIFIAIGVGIAVLIGLGVLVAVLWPKPIIYDPPLGPNPPQGLESPRVFNYDGLSTTSNWDISSYTHTPWVFDPENGARDQGCLSCKDFVYDDEALARQTFDLPDAPAIVLTYSAWWETRPDLDGLAVWVARPGSSNFDQLAFDSGSSGDEFVTREVDLSPYAGQRVEIIFGMISDSSGVDENAMNSANGVAVDDIGIWTGTSRGAARESNQRAPRATTTRPKRRSPR